MKRILSIFLVFISVVLADINFPNLSGRVVDEANIMSQDTKDRLTTMLANHENNTTNQVVVATVKSLEGLSIEEYSLQLARHWKIGQKDKNNGVLLLVAPNEREVRIEVGYGLEGVLTDATSHSIIQDIIIPNFKNNDMEKGIFQGAVKILDFMDNDESNNYVMNPAEVIKHGDSEDGFNFAIIGIFFAMFLSAFLGNVSKNKFVKKLGASMFTSLFASIIITMMFAEKLDLNLFITVFVIFTLFFLFSKPSKKSGRNSFRDDDDYGSSGGYYGGSSSSSGGFSGGGGSFGGGGASGKW